MRRSPDARQAARKATLEQIQRFRSVFSTDDGKWVLADLYREFSERTSFDPTNTHATAFMEGQRHLLLTIQARLDFPVKPLIQVILENEEAE